MVVKVFWRRSGGNPMAIRWLSEVFWRRSGGEPACLRRAVRPWEVVEGCGRRWKAVEGCERRWKAMDGDGRRAKLAAEEERLLHDDGDARPQLV